MTVITVRPITCDDALLCVEIHMRAFTGFFLTFLGKRFLHELYTSIACDSTGFGFVAEEDGQILGFVIGTDQPSGLYRRLLQKHWWKFAYASFGAFMKRPAILHRLLRAFSKPYQQLEVSNCGTLMSIAVDTQAQGKRIGQLLVRNFLEESICRGLEHVNLMTDSLDNENANRFYQRLGFMLLRKYITPEGRQMNEYVYNLYPSTRSKVTSSLWNSSLAVEKEISGQRS